MDHQGKPQGRIHIQVTMRRMRMRRRMSWKKMPMGRMRMEMVGRIMLVNMMRICLQAVQDAEEGKDWHH